MTDCKTTVDVEEKYGPDFTLEQLARTEGWRWTVPLDAEKEKRKEERRRKILQFFLGIIKALYDIITRILTSVRKKVINIIKTLTVILGEMITGIIAIVIVFLIIVFALAIIYRIAVLVTEGVWIRLF